MVAEDLPGIVNKIRISRRFPEILINVYTTDIKISGNTPFHPDDIRVALFLYLNPSSTRFSCRASYRDNFAIELRRKYAPTKLSCDCQGGKQ
jgi:hypothetical protein